MKLFLHFHKNMINKFKTYWKLTYEFTKAEKLSKSEIEFVRHFIVDSKRKKFTSSKTISLLQKAVPKLSEKWRAERAYWTEEKRADTMLIATAGDDLGISSYKVILSPDACKICRQKSQDGRKLFKTAEVEKVGYGHVPPFHPNCYCILIPVSNKK